MSARDGLWSRDPYVVSLTDAVASDRALVGTGVSGGVVEGIAHVIRDLTEETLEKARSSSRRHPIPAGRRCF